MFISAMYLLLNKLSREKVVTSLLDLVEMSLLFLVLCNTEKIEVWNWTFIPSIYLFLLWYLPCRNLCSTTFILLQYYTAKAQIVNISLLLISEFVFDKKFQRNASKFAIIYIHIQKPKVTFSVFHFVLLYIFTNWMPWSMST